MFSKNSEYAIRALVYIQLQNWEGERPGVSEIAGGTGIPVAYLAKILQTLTRHKIIHSRKGRGGGFFFDGVRPPLALYKVIHVMEGDACFNKCGFGFESCSDTNPCPLHERYVQIREGFYSLAREESIESISRKIQQGKAYLNYRIAAN